jgi:leucyl-tRNA---protein transferase
LKRIRLFQGPAHACSYLPGRLAQSLYVDTGLILDPVTYSRLAEQGFRRSGDLVYRPDCPGCSACVPVRIPVACFSPNRSQLRNLRDNGEMIAIPKPAVYTDEHYQLFQRYLAARHEDGGMADSSPEDYLGFLASDWAETWFVEFREQERLLAVAVVDRLDTGLSAVYTFFDPAQHERGLGTLAVLWQISEAKRLGLDWVYLGFWIGDCRKMSYKDRFRPLEALLDGEWRVFEKGEKIDL